MHSPRRTLLLLWALSCGVAAACTFTETVEGPSAADTVSSDAPSFVGPTDATTRPAPDADQPQDASGIDSPVSPDGLEGEDAVTDVGTADTSESVSDTQGADVVVPDAVEPPEDVAPEVVCVPDCDGAECGPDGCGGTCGDCAPGKLCSQGACINPGDCNPVCDGKWCGPNGCGGICGYCTYPEVCDPEGQCVEVCVPSCENKHCGPDGCGGTCGACEPPLLCGDNGLCYQPGCVPNCGGKVCGSDGCGGDCGVCAEPKVCQSGSCELGPCGTVTSVGECQGNVVVFCADQVVLLEDDCSEYDNHVCQYDGFANAYACQPAGPCTPKCEDKECGSDACGSWCAPGCSAGWSCLAGSCAPEQGADCGGEITTLGECINGMLWFCSGDKLYNVDCASLGQTCGWDQSLSKFGCL